jgi:hypothetical protein
MKSNSTPARRPVRQRSSFVVIVKTSEFTQDVYGPYRSFRAAEGDAKAWDGTVEPLAKRGSR